MARPMAMIPSPATRTIWGRLRSSAAPTKASDTPRAVNTTVKPATNIRAARRVTARASRRPSSDTGRAET